MKWNEKNVGISGSERKVLLFALGFAVVWSIIVTNFHVIIEQQPIIIQYVLVTLMALIAPSLILADIINGGKGFNLLKFIGSFLFIQAFDLIMPPLFVGLDGTVMQTELLFGKSAIDYVLATFYSSQGISGWALFLVTYPLTFVVMLIVSLLILDQRELKKIIGIGR